MDVAVSTAVKISIDDGVGEIYLVSRRSLPQIFITVAPSAQQQENRGSSPVGTSSGLVDVGRKVSPPGLLVR